MVGRRPSEEKIQKIMSSDTLKARKENKSDNEPGTPASHDECEGKQNDQQEKNLFNSLDSASQASFDPDGNNITSFMSEASAAGVAAADATRLLEEARAEHMRAHQAALKAKEELEVRHFPFTDMIL